MTERQPQTLEKLQGRLQKTDKALERITDMVSIPTKIVSGRLQSILEESRNDPSTRITKLLDIGERRKQIVGKLENKTLPGLTKIRQKIEEEIKHNPEFILNSFVEQKLISPDEAGLSSTINGIKDETEHRNGDKDKKREIPKVTDQAMQAMSMYLENPNITVEEIINIFGPSTKTGNLRTSPQARWALGSIVHLLIERKREGIATEAELELWEKVKNNAGKEEDRDVWIEFTSKLKKWYRSQRGQKQAKAKPSGKERAKPTPEEIPQLHDTRINALRLILGNPNVTKGRVINTLGPSSKTGRSLTLPQARRALEGSANKLFRRVREGIQTQQELRLWERMKSKFPNEQEWQTWRAVQTRIVKWYEKQRNSNSPIPPTQKPRPSRH